MFGNRNNNLGALWIIIPYLSDCYYWPITRGLTCCLTSKNCFHWSPRFLGILMWTVHIWTAVVDESEEWSSQLNFPILAISKNLNRKSVTDCETLTCQPLCLFLRQETIAVRSPCFSVEISKHADKHQTRSYYILLSDTFLNNCESVLSVTSPTQNVWLSF